MGGTTGGLIYYTIMCKILNMIRSREILSEGLISNIENNILTEYLTHSIILGCGVGYITGNAYEILDRLLSNN